MDKRLEMPNPLDNRLSDSGKRSKKRSSRKSYGLNNWINNLSNEQVSNVGFQQTYWQPSPELHPQVPNHSGQRLFTAISDPTVCGYSPMAYTMEPVSLPPMYRLYQPVYRQDTKLLQTRQKYMEKQNHKLKSNQKMNANTSTYENPRTQNLHQNEDYTSLPPTHNRNSDAEDDLNSEHRRYSDPGLGPSNEPSNNQSEGNETESSESSLTTISRNNKLIVSLIEQVTDLKNTNNQLFLELKQAKIDLENIKVKLNTFKQPELKDYQPGMFSDLVHEIREASKLFEEKIKSSISQNESDRWNEFEQLKNQLSLMIKEKEESNKRMADLEDQVAQLKIQANNEGREIAAFEEETLALRRELQEARSSRNLAENHAAKLEKLVDILRKKMNGATNEETVAEIRELVASSQGQLRPKTPDDQDHELSQRSAVDSFNESKTALANDVGVNLSGPVTDL